MGVYLSRPGTRDHSKTQTKTRKHMAAPLQQFWRNSFTTASCGRGARLEKRNCHQSLKLGNDHGGSESWFNFSRSWLSEGHKANSEGRWGRSWPSSFSFVAIFPPPTVVLRGRFHNPDVGPRVHASLKNNPGHTRLQGNGKRTEESFKRHAWNFILHVPQQRAQKLVALLTPSTNQASL
jgi:hypothetical protein